MGTKIYNSNLTNELREGIKIMSSSDATPSEITDKVVPVMEVNPKLLRVLTKGANNTAINATSATLLTTPTDRDIFIYNAQISLIKDVTSTSTLSTLRCTSGGTTLIILASAGLTLTAQTDSQTISFNPPLKVDRGTNIAITNSSATANISTTASVIYYEVLNINA
jgi:hypothetical protein